MTVTRRATPGSRGVLIACCLGNAVEWYDFAVFGASASLLVGVFFPAQDPMVGLVPTFLIFATSFLARPLGAVLVGRRADRIGRRGSFVLMIVLMTSATTAIGLLPAPESTHAPAVLLLVACRLLQGLSAGGEISTSVPFLLEHAPDSSRGLWSGWYLASAAIGLGAGTASVVAVRLVLAEPDVYNWGWRVPFLLAAPLGLVGLYLRYRAVDPMRFSATLQTPGFRGFGLFLREYRRPILRGLTASAAFSVSFNMWFVFWPSYLEIRGDMPDGYTAMAAGLGLVGLALVSPWAGWASDRIGRRPVLSIGSLCVAAWALPAFSSLASSLSQLVACNLAMGAAMGLMVVPAFVAEPFPVRLRATGVGTTLGLAGGVFGGTAPVAGAALAGGDLGHVIAVYVIVAGLLAALATWRSPESAFTELEPAKLP